MNVLYDFVLRNTHHLPVGTMKVLQRLNVILFVVHVCSTNGLPQTFSYFWKVCALVLKYHTFLLLFWSPVALLVLVLLRVFPKMVFRISKTR